ncbi:MAG: PorT family protein [Melioribacteraceae bacterium]|nr:PorT family protein [Melioribacteraceae bacterium]
MKFYKIAFLVLLFFITNSISAQLSIGAFGILSNANISGNPPSSTEYTGLTGFGGGLIVDYQFNDEITLSLQPMILPKGTTISYDLPSYKEQRDSVIVNTSYLTIPIMIKVAASKVMYVSGGFDLGFLQSAEFEYANIEGKGDLSDKINSFELSVNFAVGAKFPVSIFNVFIEGRYSQGLLNASNFPESSSTGISPEFKNSGLQLLIGILYDLDF